VKTNKLLDGASIQSDPMSCVPAAAVNLTVNGTANPPGWFTCYVAATSTPSEGASVVIYTGKDITSTTGYFDSANLTNGFYDISLTLTDKQGNKADVVINAGVRTPAPYMVDVTPTSATVTWQPSGAQVVSYVVERAPNVVDATGSDTPGTFAAISGALTPATDTFADPTTLTAETKYWYRVVANGPSAVTATSDPGMVLTALAPSAPPTFAVTTTPTNSIAVTWTQVTSKVKGYIVERTTTPGDPTSWTAVGTKAASTTTTTLTFTDHGTTDVPLVNGTTYHYRIKSSGTDYETVPSPPGAVLLP
jgi:hypothetical protein